MYLPFVNQKRACVYMLMKKLALMVCCCFWVGAVVAQPTIQWQKTYGGTSYDEAYSTQQTSDGGYIVAGRSISSNGDIFGNHGGDDFWVLKINSIGSIQWKKSLGGSFNDGARRIQETSDGGYIVVGYTASNNYDVSGNHGGISDGWVVKLSSTGTIEWQKTLGGSGRDDIWAIQQTLDNGYILAGRTSSNDGDVSENKGQLDFWVVKLNESGNIQWQKTLGGSNDDMAKSVRQTSDGGYIIAGESSSIDGDVTNPLGNADFWVVKLSSLGTLDWQKSFGGNNADIPSEILLTTDGGYVVTGYVGSGTSDISVYYGLFDFWVVKISASGQLLWEKTVGGTQPDYARAIVNAPGGGFFIAGSTSSSDGDIVENNGGSELWVVKISEIGELVWQKTYGGTKNDFGFAIDNTSDNGLVLAGSAWSTDGDLAGSLNRGKADFWVLKLSPEPSTPTSTPAIPQITLYPNPAHNTITLQAPSAGTTLNVTIYDLLGRTLLREEIPNGGQLNIAALQKGVYFVAAEDGDGTVFRGKLEKE